MRCVDFFYCWNIVEFSLKANQHLRNCGAICIEDCANRDLFKFGLESRLRYIHAKVTIVSSKTINMRLKFCLLLEECLYEGDWAMLYCVQKLNMLGGMCRESSCKWKPHRRSVCTLYEIKDRKDQRDSFTRQFCCEYHPSAQHSIHASLAHLLAIKCTTNVWS